MPVFEKVVFDLAAAPLRAAAAEFRAALDGPAPLRAGAAAAEAAPAAQGGGPPPSTMAFPALGHFLNAVLAALNHVRHVALLSLRARLRGALERAFDDVLAAAAAAVARGVDRAAADALAANAVDVALPHATAAFGALWGDADDAGLRDAVAAKAKGLGLVEEPAAVVPAPAVVAAAGPAVGMAVGGAAPVAGPVAGPV